MPKPVSPRPPKTARSGKILPENTRALEDSDGFDQEIEEIDALFTLAGLVRNRREKPAGVARRAHFQSAVPDELTPARAETEVAANGVEWVAVPGWKKMGWLWHGFSTRRGGVTRAFCADDAPGDLNLGFNTDDTRENVLRNRELLAEAISSNPATPLTTLRQVHSSVVRVTAGNQTGQPCKGDGLMTDEPGILLGVQTADCIPVLVADRKRKVVGAFHAGWRGTVKRIVETGIGRMRLEYGSRPEDMVAAIGPGIGPCCYAVGDEVLSEFESQFAYAPELFREVYDTDPVRTKYPMLFLTQRAPGHSPIGPSLHVNLMEANRRQLMDAGLKPASIQIVGGCTNCQTDVFFSHRARNGRTGRMLAVIGISR
jgi:hypothetical protein